MVRKCEECQFFANLNHVPLTRMMSLNSPIPFYQWGIDLVTDLPALVKKKKGLIVAIDYFNKWVEAEPLLVGHPQPKIKSSNFSGEVLSVGSTCPRSL